MPAVEALSRKFETLACVLDERTRRLVAAAEASAIGHGGVTLVAAASGLSRGTVMRGIAELRIAPRPERSQRIRRKGAGRKRTVDQDATLKRDLEALVEPAMEARPLPFRPLNRRSGRIPADPYPPFKCLHCRTAILARRR